LGFKKATLAKIGRDINRTRERVRQVENAGLKELKKPENQKSIKSTQKKISALVKQLGGIVTEKGAANIIYRTRPPKPEQIRNISFLITILPGMKRTKKNQIFYRYWHQENYDKKKIEAVATEYQKILAKLKEPITMAQLLAEFKKSSLAKKTAFGDKTLTSIFSIKRSLGRNKKGQVGLMKWAEINPRSARDKAYLVLKEFGQPLHYRKIAQKIKEESFYSQHNPTAPTVHNEVILDQRFVLVGRGIYALREWGYQPGTVQEVISALLRKNPQGLDRDRIIDQVSKQRQVARNTILANLNRKEVFQRIGKDRYQLK